jgi:hypothetical protein
LIAFEILEVGCGGGGGDDFGVYAELPDAAGDEVGVLAAEVDDSELLHGGER